MKTTLKQKETKKKKKDRQTAVENTDSLFLFLIALFWKLHSASFILLKLKVNN